MYIKNYEQVKSELLKCLPKYLKQQGTKFKAESNTFRCPNYRNHNNNDDKPSAMFFPDKTHFKCFSCSEYGDIFIACHYLEDKPKDGPGFLVENVLYLAKKFGIAVDIVEDEFKDKECAKLSEVLNESNRMMKLAISSKSSKVKEVNEYIKKRGWKDLYNVFDFGYCNHDKLIENLISGGYSREYIQNSGLGSTGKAVLHDRLVFPIKDIHGRIIAFASRKLNSVEDGLQRYMNFVTTKIYRKSDILFNLDRAKAYKRIYIVEGYADVFTMVANGIDNVVALCDLSFNMNRYAAITNGGINEIIFTLDSDSPGKGALVKILNEYLHKINNLKIYVKEIPEKEAKDPDEYISKYGVEKFKALKEKSLFDYFLDLYSKDLENEEMQREIFEVVLSESNFISKEKYVKKLSEVLKVGESSILKELQKIEDKEKIPQLLKTSDILLEKSEFEKSINDFDEWSQRRGELLGYKVGDWPIYNSKLDGLQSGFHIIAGNPNIGKSGFCLNLASNLLMENPDKLFILYFSLDDNLQMTLSRFLSINSGLEIAQIMNPVYRIQKNVNLTDDLIKNKLEVRNATINKFKGLSDSLIIKDASSGYTLEYIDKVIKIHHLIQEQRKLVVFIDSFHKVVVSNRGHSDRREMAIEVAKNLKNIANIYEIPIVCISELRKQQNILSKPTNLDIKESIDIWYDAETIALLHSDFDTNEESRMKYSDGDKDYPVVEVNISKNKKSPFKGKIYYKFNTENSKMEEMGKEDIYGINL